MEGYNRRLLSALKRIPNLDPTISLEELVRTLEKEDLAQVEKQKREEGKVVERYTGAFLYKKEVDSLFGETVSFLKMESLQPTGWTDQWERVYSCSFTRIRFNRWECGIQEEQESSHVNSHFTERELESWGPCSEERWSEHLEICQGVLLQLKKVLLQNGLGEEK
jgi:hypothetical protein